MCAVSAVYDRWAKIPFPQLPWQPLTPVPFWTPERIQEFKDQIEKARAQDIANNEPDCHKPEMAEFMRRIDALEAGMKRIEDKLGDIEYDQGR